MPFEVTRIANRLQLAETWESPEQREKTIAKWAEAGITPIYSDHEAKFTDHTDFTCSHDAYLMQLVAEAVFRVMNEHSKELICGFNFSSENWMDFHIFFRRPEEED